MLEAITLLRSRTTARNARPEPHGRLAAAVMSAEACVGVPPLNLDVELESYVVDIAVDAMMTIEHMKEVTEGDIRNAERILLAAEHVSGRSPVDAAHHDSLRALIDTLKSAILNARVAQRAD